MEGRPDLGDGGHPGRQVAKKIEKKKEKKTGISFSACLMGFGCRPSLGCLKWLCPILFLVSPIWALLRGKPQ